MAINPDVYLGSTLEVSVEHSGWDGRVFMEVVRLGRSRPANTAERSVNTRRRLVGGHKIRTLNPLESRPVDLNKCAVCCTGYFSAIRAMTIVDHRDLIEIDLCNNTTTKTGCSGLCTNDSPPTSGFSRAEQLRPLPVTDSQHVERFGRAIGSMRGFSVSCLSGK